MQPGMGDRAQGHRHARGDDRSRGNRVLNRQGRVPGPNRHSRRHRPRVVAGDSLYQRRGRIIRARRTGSVKSQYNLRLLFALQGSGEYLSNVQVRIDKAGGPTLLTAVSEGPWFYVHLPPGRYNLTLDNAGQVQTRRVTVPARSATEQSFYWPREHTGGRVSR